MIRLPLDRILNFVFTWVWERIHDPKQREEWMMELDAPLPEQLVGRASAGEVTGPVMWDDEFEAQTWATAMASV